MVPKSAVKKNRRDKQKQSRNDEETAGVENKVVWRTLEEIFTLYDGIQAKHQQGDSCVSYGTWVVLEGRFHIGYQRTKRERHLLFRPD